MKSININEIKNLGNINVIDVREIDEFSQVSIDGTKNIPLLGLIQNHEGFLNKGETYYIMCHSGGRSYQACQYLNDLGYDVINLEGGILAYQF